jgi:ABC-2 type transport system permease protein
VFTLAANQAVTPLIGLAVWTTALPEQQIAAYYIALLFVRLMTVSYENHIVSGRIYNGEFVDDLLLPRPFIIQPLGENLAIRIWHVIIALPLLLLVPLFVPAQFNVGHIVIALPALILAAALQFLFVFTLSLSAFWTERAHGITDFGTTLLFLLGGEAAPIFLFPVAIRPLGEALPFRAMYGFSAEIAAGALTHTEMLIGYGWQALWLVLFALLAAWVWRVGVRRYTAVGG